MRKTRSGKSHAYRDVIVFEKFRFQNVFRPQENAGKGGLCQNDFSCLKNVFVKLHFRDGLVWTVGLTVQIKLRFRDGLVWTVGLTVQIKLRFRDGLVWTVETCADV